MKEKKNKENSSKAKITKDMTFAEIIQKHPEAAKKLAEKGMMCCGCPMAMLETIEQGAISHNINVKNLLADLNKK